MSDEVLNPRVPNLRRPETENQANCTDLEGFILSRSVLNNGHFPLLREPSWLRYT